MKPFSAIPARFSSLLSTPGYRRSVFIRRVAAGVLIALAVLIAVTGRTVDDPRVVVFARDVAPGAVLTESDVELRAVPADIIPAHALTDRAAAQGQVVAAAASAGEILTTTRITGPDLVSSLVDGNNPDDYTLVPVKLAEPDIIPMLHHGDEISVVTAEEEGAVTIATQGTVVSAGGDGESAGNAAVLLLLLNEDAARVAAASLSLPITVVLTGVA